MALIALLGTLLLSACAGRHAAAPALQSAGGPPSLVPTYLVWDAGAACAAPHLHPLHLSADVVYVGEEHGDPVPGLFVRDLLHAQAAAAQPVALAVEMLPWTLQYGADRWSDGSLDEEAWLSAVDWGNVWGWPWEAYAPAWRALPEAGGMLVALNAPRELTRAIARGGLDQLDPAFLLLLPDLRWPGPEGYDALIRGALLATAEAHGGHGHFSEALLSRYVDAQRVWDSTMAERLVQARRALGEDTRFVVLAGKMHIIGGLGIPLRADRLMHVQSELVIYSAAGVPEDTTGARWWLLPVNEETAGLPRCAAPAGR